MGNNRKLTHDRAKSLVATGLQRAVNNHGFEQVRTEATCKEGCLRHALSLISLPSLHYLLNVMPIEPTVLDEALAEVGFCVMPLEVDFDQDMVLLSELSGLLSEWLGAMKDNKRDHIETLRIGARIRQLLPKLRGIVGEADRLRAVA